MKIAAKQSDECFGDISKGGVFQLNDDTYFMRINDACAVDLETGVVYSLGSCACVAAAPNVVLALEEQLR